MEINNTFFSYNWSQKDDWTNFRKKQGEMIFTLSNYEGLTFEWWNTPEIKQAILTWRLNTRDV